MPTMLKYIVESQAAEYYLLLPSLATIVIIALENHS